MDTRKRATVLSWNRKRAFGFLLPDDGINANDLFVHISALPPTQRFLLEGDVVEYTLGFFKGQPVATDVKVIGHSGDDGGAL